MTDTFPDTRDAWAVIDNGALLQTYDTKTEATTARDELAAERQAIADDAVRAARVRYVQDVQLYETGKAEGWDKTTYPSAKPALADYLTGLPDDGSDLTVAKVQIPIGYVVISDRDRERVVGPVFDVEDANTAKEQLEEQARDYAPAALNDQPVENAQDPQGPPIYVPAAQVGMEPRPATTYTVEAIDLPQLAEVSA